MCTNYVLLIQISFVLKFFFSGWLRTFLGPSSINMILMLNSKSLQHGHTSCNLLFVRPLLADNI